MEGIPNQEPIAEVSRDHVIESYRKFVELGIKSPDVLDLEDSEVKEADALFYKWQEQEDAKSSGNEDLEKRNNLNKTMIYVDAGFTDPAYLEEVLDWLDQDAQNIPKEEGNPERTQLRIDVAAAITRVKNLIGPVHN